MQSFKILFVLLVVTLSITSCSKKGVAKYGIFTISENSTTVEMDGTINSKSLDNFNSLYAAYPNVTQINIVNCEGSMDDETNLQLSQKVYDLSINTQLLDNAIIASGGVDFFLAGRKRTRGTDTRVGVHSWGSGNSSATDFPVGHSNHQPYIDYYKAIGFSQQESEDFYYFTINAASAENIHWMTEEELTKYQIFN